MDIDFNIYKIIKEDEKKFNVNILSNLPKIFIKYYKKYLINIKNELYKNDNNNDLFITNINNISNLLFQIFWTIYIGCFNQQITIFFLERASILFYEFINLAYKNKKYKVQNVSIINDAILFTLNKSLGCTTIKEILNKNKINNHPKINILKKWSHNIINIINNFVCNDKFLESYNSKEINILLNNIYTIYKNIDIDDYLKQKILSIFKNFNTEKSIFILKIISDSIIFFMNINFFKFNDNTTEFFNYFDKSLNKFIYDDTFLNNHIDSIQINKKNIYIEFKESILRFINY